MADHAKRIANLTAVSVLSANDLLIVETNTAGNSVTGKITVANAMHNIPANVTVSNSFAIVANTHVVLNSNTPANSTVNAVSRSFWFDNNYAYFALSGNTIKRVAISSF